MSFEIGFVPTGWTRGQALRVLYPQDALTGFVSLDRTKLPRTEKLPPDATGMIRFTPQEAATVKSWLEWWNTQEG